MRGMLEQHGYCVFTDWLDAATLNKLKLWCTEALANISAAHRNQYRAQGSIINILDFPVFSEMIADSDICNIFSSLGMSHPVFCSGSIISKPPAGPTLFWHQDWWAWDHPLSYTNQVSQVNVMIYLQATSVENGCLRVIPGSHRHVHPIHDINTPIDAALSRVDNPEDPAYQSWPDEQAIAVQPGDVVVKDSRLLHSAYPNTSSAERTLLSLNYNPDYPTLPAALKAAIQDIFHGKHAADHPGQPGSGVLPHWSEEQRKRIEMLIPHYSGNELPVTFNTRPDPALLLGG